jgi:hypothetical protein
MNMLSIVRRTCAFDFSWLDVLLFLAGVDTLRLIAIDV